MAIKLTISTEVREINEQNFQTSLETIAAQLTPGTPVMLQNYSSSDLGLTRGKHIHNILFISDGYLHPHGTFSHQKGKRNFAFITSGYKHFQEYQIVHHWQEQLELDNNRLTIPHDWTREQYNEGTFSRSGPELWLSSHSAGTEEIIIGDQLKDRFPEAIDALKFTQDAIHFTLHPFYSHLGYLTTKIGDKSTPEGNLKKDAREREARDLACLKAVVNLIAEANYEQSDRTFNHVHADQLGWYHEGGKYLRAKGVPVNDTDYLVREIMHPQRNLAFVKLSKGMTVGETYILPASKMDQIVESAFTEERIKKYYPYGKDEKK